MLDVYVKRGTRFSLRGGRLSEINEVGITRVNCNCIRFLMYRLLEFRSSLAGQIYFYDHLICISMLQEMTMPLLTVRLGPVAQAWLA